MLGGCAEWRERFEATFEANTRTSDIPARRPGFVISASPPRTLHFVPCCQWQWLECARSRAGQCGMFALDRYPTPLTHRVLPVRRGKYGSMMRWALSAALPATHQQPHNPHIRGPMVAVPCPMGEVRWRFDSSTWVGASAPCRQPPLVEKGAPSPSAHPPSPHRAHTDRLAPRVLPQIAQHCRRSAGSKTPWGRGLVPRLRAFLDIRRCAFTP